MYKNYKLEDGKYLHFHDCDDGYDFTLFTSDGIDIDGGILETTSKNEEEIINNICDMLDIPKVTMDKIIEIDYIEDYIKI